MKGIIYKATNIFDGKIYIGQTTSTLERRVKEHLKGAYREHGDLARAINSQGHEAFSWEEVESFEGDEDEIYQLLDAAEHYYILKSQSYLPSKGYNMQLGGIGGKLSSEARNRTTLRNRPLIQYSKEGQFIREFRSMQEMEKEMGLSNRGAYSARSLEKGLHYGSQWRIKRTDDFPSQIPPYDGNKSKKVKVVAYHTQGEHAGTIYGIYSNFRAAHRDTGCLANRNLMDFSDNIKSYQVDSLKYIIMRCPENPPQKITIVQEDKPTIKTHRGKPSIPVVIYNNKGQFIAECENLTQATKICGKTILSKDITTELPPVVGENTRYIVLPMTNNYPKSIKILKNWEFLSQI